MYSAVAKEIIKLIVGVGVVTGLLVWGLYEGVVFLAYGPVNIIRVEEPMIPTLEITVIKGIADTTYVYQIP